MDFSNLQIWVMLTATLPIIAHEQSSGQTPRQVLMWGLANWLAVAWHNCFYRRNQNVFGETAGSTVL